MTIKPFTFKDIERECEVQLTSVTLVSLKGKQVLGAKVAVPEALQTQFPYNSSAYEFLQNLRTEIFELGFIEFPSLPVIKTNYTVAIRSPQEHRYSDNPYLFESCQQPHQDTPPYPTAFWLAEKRHYSATWLMTDKGRQNFESYRVAHKNGSIEELHRHCVAESLTHQTGLLVNHEPGLILIDNSSHQNLYHAKTRNFAAVESHPGFDSDAPMYSFNEVGLLNYIDVLDSRRGQGHRNRDEAQQIRRFMQQEGLGSF